MRPRWLRLVLEDGDYNPRVRELARGRSGAYAIREIDSHRVMYVGESSCGKLWKTMLRHFQAPDSFAKVRETGVFKRGPTHYEVALWPTSTGNRRCTRQGPGKNEKGDQRALNAQARWIKTLRPENNKDDGQAFDADEWRAHRAAQAAQEANDPFGILNPGNPRVVVDAPLERRAENRTPDLFTGRTKLEDRKGGARRDWKGEADRLARELAECRRAPAQMPPPPIVPVVAPRPRPRPEGYGDVDTRGQATMFRRNPEVPPLEGDEREEFVFRAGTYFDRLDLVDMRDGSFDIRIDGRVAVHGLHSKEWAEWLSDAYRTAATDARAHRKVSELVSPPPARSPRFDYRVTGFGFNDAGTGGVIWLFTVNDEGDRDSESLAYTDTRWRARFAAQLGQLGLEQRAAFDRERVEREKVRAAQPTHQIRPGMRVRWSDSRGSYVGLVESLEKGDKLRIGPYVFTKRGRKQGLSEPGPLAWAIHVRNDDVRELEKPEPKKRRASAPRARATSSRVQAAVAKETKAFRGAAAARFARPAPQRKPAGFGEEETKGKKAGQLRMFNPRGVLTNMGALTELQGRDVKTGRARVLRWSLRNAPTLAYDEAGRLFIVYGGRVVRPTTAAETAEYRRTHWGRAGRRAVTEGAVSVPPFRRIMVGESITYTCEKGTDAALVDYVHPWGEGARGKWLPPMIVEHECHPETCRRGKCAAKGSVALMGGTYKVDTRGIVG